MRYRATTLHYTTYDNIKFRNIKKAEYEKVMCFPILWKRKEYMKFEMFTAIIYITL